MLCFLFGLVNVCTSEELPYFLDIYGCVQTKQAMQNKQYKTSNTKGNYDQTASVE